MTNEIKFVGMPPRHCKENSSSEHYAMREFTEECTLAIYYTTQGVSPRCLFRRLYAERAGVKHKIARDKRER